MLLTPVHKNNSVHDRSNCRPLSMLRVISKPLERHVERSYLDYFTSKMLLHSKQSAYPPYHPCETVLLSLTDNWLKAMNSKELVGAVLLDLSKAFDLVDRSLLLSKINMYHIDNIFQQWLESYLRHQSLRCCINGHFQSLEAFHEALSWAPSSSCCTSMAFH